MFQINDNFTFEKALLLITGLVLFFMIFNLTVIWKKIHGGKMLAKLFKKIKFTREEKKS